MKLAHNTADRSLFREQPLVSGCGISKVIRNLISQNRKLSQDSSPCVLAYIGDKAYLILFIFTFNNLTQAFVQTGIQKSLKTGNENTVKWSYRSGGRS